MSTTPLLEVQHPSLPESTRATYLDAFEGLSMSFNYHIHLLSQSELNTHSLIYSPISIMLRSRPWPTPFHGLIYAAVLTEHSPQGFTYQLSVQPWFATLAQHFPQQIFQGLGPVEIFIKICKGQGFADFDTSQLCKVHSPLCYMPQLQESSFDFLSRILAEAGIFYYYRHSSTQHVLCLVDDVMQLPTLKPPLSLGGSLCKEHISQLTQAASPAPQQVRIASYSIASGHSLIATYPQHAPACDHYTDDPTFSNPAIGHSLARQKFKALSAHASHYGSSTHALLRPGCGFHIALHSPSSRYVLLSVQHLAYDSSHSSHHSESAPVRDYCNYFQALSSDLQYHPNFQEPPPLSGLHSAACQASPHHSIDCQTYGQVRARFTWEQSDQAANNAYYLRVAQRQAGLGMGHIFMPRHHTPVWIGFYQGRSNLPLICASTYNQLVPPPYSPLTHPGLSGIKTRSLITDSTSGHHLIMSDTPNHERLSLLANQQFMLSVLNNATYTLRRSAFFRIKGEHHIGLNKGSVQLNSDQSISLNAGSSSLNLSPNHLALKADTIKVAP